MSGATKTYLAVGLASLAVASFEYLLEAPLWAIILSALTMIGLGYVIAGENRE